VPTRNRSRSQRPDGPRRRIPVTTWIGIAGTALLALIGLATGGFWSMLAMIMLVVLPTTIYGVLFRRATWLRLPRKRAAAAIGVGIAIVALLGSTSAYGATHPSTEALTSHAAMTTSDAPRHVAATPTHTAAPKSTPTPTPTPTPVVSTKDVVETVRIPFGSTTVQSATLAEGTSSVTTPGVDGVDTKTYSVTYSDGVETGRVLQSDLVTTQPVTQVTTVGTYVAPAMPSCSNGTYVNSAGATVCRPEAAPSAPVGATAKCSDGTYSFSQSRRGTCSSHGGVAAWL
jgi:hypothetical protein